MLVYYLRTTNVCVSRHALFERAVTARVSTVAMRVARVFASLVTAPVGPSSRARPRRPPARFPTRCGEGAKGKKKGGASSSNANAPERLDRLLSRLGYCTRAEAKRWARDGRVLLHGEPVARAEAKVTPRDVLIDGEPAEAPDGLLALMHKPRGRVCGHDASEGTSVYDLLPERWRARRPGVETIGRLDKDTTGLLLLTDDGDLLHRLASPKKRVEKVYELVVDAPIPRDAVDLFASGSLTLTGEKKPCLPAKLIVSERADHNRTRASLSVTEGKFHQVKRMMRAVGCEVTALHRESFGGMALSRMELREGEVRVLSRETALELIGIGGGGPAADDG